MLRGYKVFYLPTYKRALPLWMLTYDEFVPRSHRLIIIRLHQN
jgi:hypothetical protein